MVLKEDTEFFFFFFIGGGVRRYFFSSSFFPSLHVFWDFGGWRVASFVKISHPLHTYTQLPPFQAINDLIFKDPNYSSDYASWVVWLIN